MFKAFTAGLTGIILSTSLGVLAASTATNANSSFEAPMVLALYID